MAGDARIGTVVAGCEIISVIGRGGMGVVYLAEQVALRRRVALKLLSPELAQDPEFRQRFETEARLAASLDHPNVVPIHAAGESDGQLYIVMRWVDGIDLRQMLREHGGRLPAGTAATLALQVADALDAAHARGLVHRDVKPANVLVTSSRQHAYLTDFGLTKLAAASSGGLTRTGQWLGTIDYVAPEQIEGGRLDARTDVYALGCLLFQSLAGTVPYPREHDVAKVWAHVNAPPPLLAERAPELPQELSAVVARAMAKNPAERWASAGGLARAVAAAVEQRPLPADDASVATGPAAPRPATGPPPDEAPDEAPTATVALPPPTRRLPRPPANDPPRRARRIPALVALAATTLVVGGLVALASRDGGGERVAATVATTTEQRARRPSPTAAKAQRTRTAASGRPDAAASAGTPAAQTATAATTPPPRASAPPTDYARYEGLDYSVERPAAWAELKADAQESEEPPRYRSQWSSSGCGCTVVIDWIPGYGLSALENAAEAGSGEIEPATVGGFDDAALRTAASGDLHTATYYMAYGGGNLAVRAEARSLATALAIADHVAGTLQPRGE